MESAKVTDAPMAETVPETLAENLVAAEADQASDTQKTDLTESATENLQPAMNVQPATEAGAEEQKSEA